ncbi:MAG: ATP-binding protein [Micrococcales bacterium 70-64]|nr:ATP-binding protein [Leifsonia sp.]ODU64736.1 MAG: ATP-binding protein [Leifsonia sp. SCN 70-46]OJX86427.1 MAG: ATP-binding protein [Micrococcales bacterium 70-64]
MIVLVDGRSGSGKSELATLLAERLGAQLVRLDDVYPGWDGLDAASAAVPGILTTGRWRRWDWATSSPAEEHVVDLARPLIVEGVGALSRASRPLADRALWVELDAATRKRRALARESYFAQHWGAWAAQEDRFIAREDPRSLADAVVDGTDVRAFSLEWRP